MKQTHDNKNQGSTHEKGTNITNHITPDEKNSTHPHDRITISNLDFLTHASKFGNDTFGAKLQRENKNKTKHKKKRFLTSKKSKNKTKKSLEITRSKSNKKNMSKDAL